MNPIREELEKVILEAKKSWLGKAIWKSNARRQDIELEERLKGAFLAGLKASLLAGPEPKKCPVRKFSQELHNGTFCNACDEIRAANKYIKTHTAKVEEMIAVLTKPDKE